MRITFLKKLKRRTESPKKILNREAKTRLWTVMSIQMPGFPYMSFISVRLGTLIYGQGTGEKGTENMVPGTHEEWRVVSICATPRELASRAI